VQADALDKPSSFLGKFDMIVSNPPYITAKEMEELPVSVKDYEPHLALYGGEDGLDFYRSIADKYRDALKVGGYLCFEFGMGQGDAVCAILKDNGFDIVERVTDYNNIERAVLAQYNRKEC
jgi:release factor glutamine methyltransferase